MKRTLIAHARDLVGHEVIVRGWVQRYRELSRTTFIVLGDCSGSLQSAGATDLLREQHIKLDDAVELRGRLRADERSRDGFELDILDAVVLNPAASMLPFNSSTDMTDVPLDVLLDHRPLALRTPAIGDIFRVQAAIVERFRDHLREQRFTEIITSKLVGGGTEGGTNLFAVDYFERTAYLAQSPQFYKEHGTAGFERVFETGHVYRAEPHATSRHLAEYYSLDLEMGFIDGPEDVMAVERALLTDVFATLNDRFADALARRGAAPLPSMLDVPVWEFADCLERLAAAHGRRDLHDDLDPEAERQLCALAESETGVPAVFVIGFPLANRPFYTAPRGEDGAAESFDLLFRGVEITTGGQRLHRRVDLESALERRGIDPAGFADHLRMFDVGMPPHGGLAIGLERLTMLVMGLTNVREATLYPRDRHRLAP